MSTVTLVGNDIITLNDNNISDLAEGVVASLAFENDISTTNVGKNGNSIYILNESGKVALLTLRVLRASPNDIYLNSLLNLMQLDLPSFPLMNGEFIKRVGDGNGNVKKDTYTMSGGIFVRNVDASEDKSGGVDQAVAIYTIRFSNAPRVIG